MAGQAQEVHGHEDAVDADEGEPEVDLAERLVQHPAEHLREPEVRGREDAEDRRHAHDQVEVRDHEVRVVQVQVERGLRQEEARQAAGDEQRHEAEREQHRQY